MLPFLLAAGCGGTFVAVSVPTIAESDGWSASGHVVKGPGIDIALYPVNGAYAPPSASDMNRKFAIRMMIGGDDIASYALDPERIRLMISHDESTTFAKVYHRLGTSGWITSDKEVKIPTSLSEKTRWFELRFDIEPLTPETQFALLIDGLTKANGSFKVPKIVFRKGMEHMRAGFI